MRGDVAALAAAHGVGRRAAAPAAPARRARNTNGRAVLLRAANMIGNVAGGGHVVKLRGRVFLAGPRLAAVERDIGAAVIALHHAQRVGRVDPQVVIVPVRRGHGAVSLAAVGGAEEPGIEHVHGVLHLRVGVDARIVEGALPQTAVFAEQFPCRARVVGNKDAAIFVFHDGVYTVPVGAGHRHADLADDALRHAGAARDLGPVVAAVGGFEEAAGGSAARKAPWCAVGVPDGGKEDVRVLGVEAQVHRARAIIAEEDFGPGLPAVLGTEDAALRVRVIGVAQRGYVDHVGVGGMHADARDGLRVGEAHVLPRLAGVGGFVHAVALHDVAAQLGFAHADVDHVGVRFRHRHGAHRGTFQLPVGDRTPSEAAIGGLPEAAAGGAKVVFQRE